MNTIRNPILPTLPETDDPEVLKAWRKDITEYLQRIQENIYDDVESTIAEAVAKMTNPMTTLGDLIVGGAGGVPGRLGIGAANKKLFVNAAGTDYEFDTGIYQNHFTIDTASASGSTNITVVPFKPSHAELNAVINGTAEVSWGKDNGTTHLVMEREGAVFGVSLGNSVFLYQSAGVYHYGYISAWLSNGFTYTWVKAGAKTGTAYILYTLHR